MKTAIPIIVETTDYLVINKPAGLLVHPTTKTRTHHTVAELLVKDYPELEQVGDIRPWYRPGIVHRLDRDASGVLVVARTPAMYHHLRQAFDHHQIEKTYMALVQGKMNDETGTIETPIARSKDLKRQITQERDFDPTLIWLPAITHWKVQHRYTKETLIEIRTETGRTQQIRVHLASVGHPLVGDHLYGTKSKMDRIFLHAMRLKFVDLEGTPQTFEAPLPPELETYLKRLR